MLRGWATPVMYPDGTWAMWDFSEHHDSASEISTHATYDEALTAAEWHAWLHDRKVERRAPDLTVIEGGAA